MDVDPLVENDPWRQFRSKAMSFELGRQRSIVEARLVNRDALDLLPLHLLAVLADPAGPYETDTKHRR